MQKLFYRMKAAFTKQQVGDYLMGYDPHIPGFWLSALIVFGVLFFLHITYLAEPPFWDEIFGVHNQAIWLAHHKFHYFELCSKEEIYAAGGSWIYPFDFVPWIFGAFYAVFPPVIVHSLCRLLSAFSASICIVCFFQICRVLKIKVILVWFCALFFASLPFFIGQAIAAGQEMILAALMMLSLYFFMKDHFFKAIFWAFLACSIKLTAIFLPISYTLYYFFQLIHCKGEKYKREIFLSILCVCVFPLLTYAVMPSSQLFQSSALCDFGGVCHRIIAYSYRAYRDFFFVILFSGLSFAFFAWKNKTLRSIIDSRVWVFLITVIIFFVCFFIPAQDKIARCYRYATIVVFPAAVAVAVFISNWKISRICIFLGIFVVINLLNQKGLLMPNIPSSGTALGANYERSKEYFDMIRAQKKMIKEIDIENQPDQYICATPYAQILTMPELGYISKSIPKILTGVPSPKYIKSIPLMEYDHRNPIHVFSDMPLRLPCSELADDSAIVLRKAVPIENQPYGAIVVYDIVNIESQLKKLKR